MLYLKIASALQSHLCIFTNIVLYHELNFVSVVQNSFPHSVTIFCNYLADSDVLRFCCKKICTLLFKAYISYI